MAAGVGPDRGTRGWDRLNWGPDRGMGGARQVWGIGGSGMDQMGAEARWGEALSGTPSTFLVLYPPYLVLHPLSSTTSPIWYPIPISGTPTLSGTPSEIGVPLH